MNIIDLNGEWTLKGIAPDGGEIELCGTVPGSTLNDVLSGNAEECKNIFYRDNAEKIQKYENYDWEETRRFVLEEVPAHAELVFEGLDTYCDIYLNDTHIAYCDNAFISYKFEVDGILRKGENEIEVRFYSSVRTVKGRKSRWAAFSTDRLYTRRMQCTYGWDWVMRFVTCGICGDVYIRPIENGMKAEDVYIYTKSIDEDCAEIGIDIDFADFEEGGVIKTEIYSPRKKLVRSYSRYNQEAFMRIALDVEKPMLWNPVGYGEPNLYEIVISCDSRELYRGAFGIRTAKIMQLPDREGSENYNKCREIKESGFSREYDKNEEFSGFILKVNGTKIMCKGANWVPCEPFSGKDEKKKITTLLELAKEAGVNMLRVWGGGRFECEHFYDECSRLGIMVTQDFLMACGSYPEKEEWFLRHLKNEAEYAAKLLKNKACLMWWSGDNENAVNGCNEDSDYRGRDSAYKAIAPVIYKRDPRREFLPSSPFGGRMYASNTVGTTHNTQYLGYLFKYITVDDMKSYRDMYKKLRARFIAEEPILGAVSLTSLRKFMTDEDIFGDNPDMWRYHTKSNPGLSKEIFEYVTIMTEKVFGKFSDGADSLFKYQYLQYEWVRISLEQARREKWFSSGIIYWMFNDCWPAACGWALVDYYCMPKAAYYSFKRAAKEVIGSIDYDGGVYRLYICNDSKAQTVRARCFAVSENKEIREIMAETELDTAANSSCVAFEINTPLDDDDVLIFEIIGEDGSRDRSFYRHSRLEPEVCETEVLEKTDEYITVRAKKYVHTVVLEGEAVFEDNYFSLLPNEIRRVFYRIVGDCAEVNVSGYTLKIGACEVSSVN